MPALTERIAAMWQAFPWDLMLDSPHRADDSHQEHLAILSAMEDGDPDRVGEATEIHLRNGFSAILGPALRPTRTGPVRHRRGLTAAQPPPRPG